LGNPTGFFLTGGEVHALVGADHLLPKMEADTLIADKAFDADAHVLEPLAAAGKTAVIPPRPADPHYATTTESFMRRFVSSSPAITRPSATSSPLSSSSLASFGLIDDRP
jgi:hypothetical protein